MFKSLAKATLTAGFLLTSAAMAQAEEDDDTGTFNDGVLYPFESTIQMNSPSASAPATGEFDDGSEGIDNLSKERTGQDRQVQQNRRMQKDNPDNQN